MACCLACGNRRYWKNTWGTRSQIPNSNPFFRIFNVRGGFYNLVIQLDFLSVTRPHPARTG